MILFIMVTDVPKLEFPLIKDHLQFLDDLVFIITFILVMELAVVFCLVKKLLAMICVNSSKILAADQVLKNILNYQLKY